MRCNSSALHTTYAACFVLVLMAALPASADDAVDIKRAPDHDNTQHFALIVGNNRSSLQARPDLRYADDDAIRHRDVLASVLPQLHVEMLTRPDADTERLYGADLGPTTPPTRAAFAAARKRLQARVADAKAAGQSTELFVVFAGHGERDAAGGYLELEDDALRRADLLQLLQDIHPDRAHVLLDACNSFFVVNARRPGGRSFVLKSEVVAGLDVDGVDVGVLLSTSSDGQVFEWSQLQGGIFSHALRSGLLGPADANQDGQVTYLELHAFVDTATRDLRNAEYRPSLFMNADDDQVLVRLPKRRMLLDVPPGKLTIRDARGIRIADIHPEEGYLPSMVLAGMPPHQASLLRDGDAQAQALRAPLSSSTPTPPALSMLPAPRGPPLLFGDLFKSPFGPNAVAQHATQRRDETEAFGLSREQKERLSQQLLLTSEQARAQRFFIGGLGLTVVAAAPLYASLAFVTPDPSSTSGFADGKPDMVATATAVSLGLLLAGTGLAIAIPAFAIQSDEEDIADTFFSSPRDGRDVVAAATSLSTLVEKRNGWWNGPVPLVILGGLSATASGLMLVSAVALPIAHAQAQPAGWTWSETNSTAITLGMGGVSMAAFGGLFLGAAWLQANMPIRTNTELMVEMMESDPDSVLSTMSE